MKNILATMALLGIITTASAQYETTKYNNFKVNIFSPIVKTGSFFFERKLDEKSSAQLGAGFTAYKGDGVKVSGLFFTPEYRQYLSASKEAMEGFYIGPYLRYQNLKIEDEVTKAKLSTFGGGLSIGHQWIFRDLISLDLFAGPSYNSGKIKITEGNDDPDVPGSFEGFGVRSGVTIGITF